MKKLILSALMVFAAITISFAQQGGAERMEQMKKALKEQASLTDVQIDTVMAIDAEFRPRLREIRMDKSMSEDDKTAKMKVLNEEKSVRLQGALGKETADKVDAFYAAMRNRRPNGGGERPAGDK